ncbi:class I SAM-dependent methyltransferase [Sphaerisporangium viridialbum]|uniref:class I SAM-dependent methyltransferase n=1 Tax=Sphaerisporangium viridialbum TaxID=46189 RepID=UPI003C763B51
MNNGEPSQTALMAAAARAAHLIVDDEPRIFADTLAYELLGDRADELVGYHRAHGTHVILAGARAAAVTRSRYTEDRLAEAVGGGIRQYVILGAGLDSYAYRAAGGSYVDHPEPDGRVRVQVFEVDHPATQRWKIRLLEDAGVAVPGTVTFVPLDFETESLLDRLVGHEFDPSRPAFVSWLGVTMYLTREAIGQTLTVIGGFAPGTEVVADSMLPEDLRDEAGQAYVEAVMPVSAGGGEPWLTFLGPEGMASLLKAHGFDVVEHARQRDAVDASLWDRSDALRPYDLSLLTHARVPGRIPSGGAVRRPR